MATTTKTTTTSEVAKTSTKAKAAAAPKASAAVAQLLAQWDALKAEAKSIYEQIDDIEAAIVASLPVGEPVALTDGRTGRVRDNFVDKNGDPKNIAWKPCGVRRFEIEVK